jgi:hypothetical protein
LETWLTQTAEQLWWLLASAWDMAQQLNDPLEHAIRFFAAATPFIYALTLFVALTVILLFFRRDRRRQDEQEKTESEWREKLIDLIDKLSGRIL